MKKLAALAASLFVLATPSTALGHSPVSYDEAISRTRDNLCYVHGHCMSYNYGCRINNTAFWLRWSSPTHKHEVKFDHDHLADGTQRYIITVYAGWISGWPHNCI